MYSGFALSEDLNIKLECNIDLKDSFNDKLLKTSQYVEVFDVDIQGNVKSIMPVMSEYFKGVSTKPAADLISFKDDSRDNNFDISVVRKEKNGEISTQIRIERDTGKIFYVNKLALNLNTSVQRGVGNCTKLNPAKNKF